MRPGIKTFIVGLLLCLGAFAVPFLFILPLILGKSDRVQFTVPGKCEFTAAAAGRYYLWNDYETIYNGKSYNRSKETPDGIDIQIHDTNGPVQFTSDTSTSVSGGGTSRASIGYVDLTHPEKLEIEIAGGAGNRIFSFGKSGMLRMMGMILGGLAATIFVGVTGFILVVLGAIKLIKGERRES